MSFKTVDINVSGTGLKIEVNAIKTNRLEIETIKSIDLVWITREEFNRSLMLQEMSVTSLKALMNFANSQSIASKEYAMNAFSIDDLISYKRLNLDFLNWNGLYTACLNEVNQRGEA